jgi:pyrroline-5-carboxylate reductase
MGLQVGIIGCGNMGTAIAQGLKNAHEIECLRLMDRNSDKIDYICSLNGAVSVQVVETIAQMTENLDVLLLLVKPKDIENVLKQFSAQLDLKTLVVSCAAGLPLKRLKAVLSQDQPVARVMPNTAARFGRSTTTVIPGFNNTHLNDVLEAVFKAIGKVIFLAQEEDMHVATALAGSGPAFFLLLIEKMTEIGMQRGLSESLARELAHGGLEGAAVLAQDKSHPLSLLREQITSPGGTTEAGLNHMRAQKLDQSIQETVIAATERSIAMAREKKS